MGVYSLSSRLTLTLFIRIIGCVSKLDPLDSCTSGQDCFWGEVCLERAEGDARCVLAGSEPVTDSSTEEDLGLIDAFPSADANADDDAALPTDVGISN